jgi:hypothetical protein
MYKDQLIHILRELKKTEKKKTTGKTWAKYKNG